MSLLWIDGFDHYATADILSMYSAKTSTPAIVPTGGRFGGGGLQAPDNTSGETNVSKALNAPVSTIVVGMAIKMSNHGSGNDGFLVLREGAAIHLILGISSTGVITLFRGNTSTTLHLTSTTLTLDVFHYVELKANIHDSTGSYDIHFNGVSIGSASGVDTRNGGATGVVSSVDIGADNSVGFTATWTFDDLYILDTTGAAPNNDFLGDARVDTIFPDAEGNYSQFTPSTGTDNSALVDDATPNGDTDYNSDSTATNKDSYDMEALAAITTQTIYGVQTSMYMRKTDAGARSAKVGVRSNVTDSVSAAQALVTEYMYYHNIHELDPDTASAWTESGVNAMETLVETV